MNTVARSVLLLAAAAGLAASPAARAESLEAGFAQPPAAARPLVWWHWVNGNITKEGIEKDLADMKRVGIAGAQMFDVSIYLPPGPVRYGTDRWHEHVQFAIQTAKKYGLEFHAMNTPGWSASGGPWVTPERSMKQLVWSETTVDGGPGVQATLPTPECKLPFYRDIVVIAVPADANPAQPLRIEDWKQKTKMAEGTFKRIAPEARPTAGAIPRDQVKLLSGHPDHQGRFQSDLPPGRWTLLRFGFTSTGSQNHPAVPEGHGLEIDKMDADAVSFYFDRALGRQIREAGPLAGTTFKAILFDSFEGGPQNWTEQFPRQFKEHRGYDLLPYLPALTGRVIQSVAFTEAFLSDFRKAVEDTIAQNYFGTMRRRAHEHGLITFAEAQGGPLNPVSSNEYVDVPMNEFWVPDTAPRAPRIKLVSSVANLLGRPIVAAESFTAKPEDGKWQNSPSTLKNPGDYAWTVGINRFILHHYTHQPTDYGPGFGLGRYGTNFGRLNTWWPLAADWVSYVSRGQFLLQQGHAVADIAFLQNEDHGYGFPTGMVAVPPGYQFDICYPRHLRDLQWDAGQRRLTLPTGPAYRLLMLPDNWAADLPTLRRLRDLAQAGAPIFGPRPISPAGVRDFDAMAEYQALIAELWDDGKAGHALVSVKPLAAALPETRTEPDVAWPARSDGGEFRYLHRRTADADVYFIFNYSAQPAAGPMQFRVGARQPELWDAVANSHVDAPVFSQTAHGISVPLALEPYGSQFVIFRRPLPARWVKATQPTAELSQGRLLAPSGGRAVTLTYSDGQTRTVTPPALPPPVTVPGPWQVAFVDGRGAPPETTLTQLASWTEHADAGIKFYSGVARYSTTFPIDPAQLRDGQIVELDLGRVGDLAEVSLNGRVVRTLWQPPFRTDVTAFLRAGPNQLDVRVANRWINRLIGDESLPTQLEYQKPGTNKFTDGKLLASPAWLYDSSKLSEKKRYSFATWKHYSADSPLVPAGLMGPVQLVWRAVILP